MVHDPTFKQNHGKPYILSNVIESKHNKKDNKAFQMLLEIEIANDQ